MAAAPDAEGNRPVSWNLLSESLGRARYAFDKQGEEFYNLISAFIKSLRNSDANAAVYWLARMIEGGADPMFIARRLCILASEDVGMADPQAIVQAAAAAQVTHLIGLPEALFPLTQATIYPARAPKSKCETRSSTNTWSSLWTSTPWRCSSLNPAPPNVRERLSHEPRQPPR